MIQTKTQEEVILEMIKTLPLQQQEEVINFIEFLQFKAQKQDSNPLKEEKQPMSAYEAAKEFAGCLEGGPTDLSTNKKYLQGNW